MGHIEVFRVNLSDFHSALSLVCLRDFQGNYFLEAGDFNVQLMHPERLGAAGQRLKARAEAAERADTEMKPGKVWQYDLPKGKGVIEIGINESGEGVYVQCGALWVEPDVDQCGAILFALGRLRADYADVMLASSGPQQSNVVPALRWSGLANSALGS